MRTYIGTHQAASPIEFEELALGFDELPAGIDRDLFRGPLAAETPRSGRRGWTWPARSSRIWLPRVRAGTRSPRGTRCTRTR